MKTYCKPKDCRIEDFDFNLPAVECCFRGAPGKTSKLGRKDFRGLLAETGIASKQELRKEHESGQYGVTNKAIEKVVENLTDDIRNRDLQLKPVRQFRKADGLSKKERDICQESPKQQVHEYILVNALMPLFKAKFLPCQYGSIPGRGPELGKRKIERILRKTCKNGKTDAVQGDVRKTYPSTTVECVLALLRRDIGKNETLIWYAGAVMSNYPNGALLIGGYFSSYAFNYVMSYVLRYFLSLYQIRRGKRIRLAKAAVCYADDFLLVGHISQLKRAMKKAACWAHNTLGLTFKPEWKVMYVPGFESEKECKAEMANGSHKRTTGIDMMGYVVRSTYTIIRSRIFLRLRRYVIRAWKELLSFGYVPWWRAETLMSAKGRLKNSNSRKFRLKYHATAVLRAAAKSISTHIKKGMKVNETAICGTTF